MNQRNHERLPFSGEFVVKNGHRITGRGVDVSSNGLGFVSEEPLEIGTRVNLIFQKETFMVEGVVRYSTPETTPFRFRNGVKFTMDARYLMPVLMMLENTSN
ncbi:MAG: PilZ domain-containing protein [Deltaproteobacteria bacterium]|nr:PilZ domain-containing protein [Deltaproteobacteria bacterium]